MRGREGRPRGIARRSGGTCPGPESLPLLVGSEEGKLSEWFMLRRHADERILGAVRFWLFTILVTSRYGGRREERNQLCVPPLEDAAQFIRQHAVGCIRAADRVRYLVCRLL